MRVEVFKLALGLALLTAFALIAFAVECLLSRRWKRPDSAVIGWIALILLGVVVISGILAWATVARARDLDGRYAASPLKPWFDRLKSARGPCCSDADGTAVADVDWESKGGHYRVRLHGEWVDVPDDAVLTEPNLDGRTIVWTMGGSFAPNGTMTSLQGVTIRCFMPGSMS